MLKVFPLFSGGVDSTVAILKRIKKKDFDRLHPVFFNYGQRACEQEWTAVQKIWERLPFVTRIDGKRFVPPTRINLYDDSTNGTPLFSWSKAELFPWGSKGNFYVENRNMVLASIAASFAEAHIDYGETAQIITGFRDEFNDTKAEFLRRVNRTILYVLAGKKKVVLKAPIIHYGEEGKTRMVQDFKRYEEILRLTWSCYDPTPKGEPCKKCDACRGTIKALDTLKK
jgi:queuosine biosynthesis protein QueC